MGLIKAGIGALGGTLADQWKEFFYCDAMDMDTLAVKGQKRVGGRSSNTKGEDNVISNGSGIAVADGQCMMIVEQGKVVEVCAEPGEYTYDSSSEPSIFAGSFGESLKNTFKTIGKRFTFGGDAAKDQRVYYFNTKEIMGNKFGTPTPILFEVVNKAVGFSRTVNVRCNGVYSYVISDPLLFYTKVCGNFEGYFGRESLDEQLKAEFVSALQPAFGALAEMGLRPAQLPAKANELREAMNDALKVDWQDRGLRVEKIALNPISLTEEDLKKIQEMEDSVSYGANASMMAGRMTAATAAAMEKAAGNSAGAMTGFMGMNMAGGAMGGGFAAAGELYKMGQSKPCAESWRCACGQECTGKFCPECGAKKPDGTPQYRCDKCGWRPEDPTKAPKFCPECGDPFDNGDVL